MPDELQLEDGPTDARVMFDESACAICQSEMCEGEHFEPDSAETNRKHTVGALTFQSAHELSAAPRPVEIIEGAVWAGCITVLVSESGTGKTFIALNASAAVSDARPWNGREVVAGAVAYISYEGDALGLRLRALREVQHHKLEHVYVLRASEPLSPTPSAMTVERPSRGELAVSAALDALAERLRREQGPPITLVIVDTVRASLAGSEDSSECVAAYLRAVRRILTHAPHAGVILAHHAGWQDGEAKRRRERGSSAFRGNCDATLYLEAGDYDAEHGTAPLTLSALKVRDAERPAPLHLIRRRVEFADRVGRDLRRGPLTSCVIEHDHRSREDHAAAHQQAVEADAQHADLAVLRAMRDYPTATSISRLRPYVRLRTEMVSDAVARILRAGWATEGKRGEAYRVTETGASRLDGATS